MNNIDIKGTSESPTITLDVDGGKLLIEGRSIIEDPNPFYEPLINELTKLNNTPLSKFEIDFKLEYFNTSSSKSILHVLKVLRSKESINKEIIINWYYDEGDDDILEIGEDFSHIINFPFVLKVIPN